MELDRPASPIDRWALDPSVVHLNHGSFGGCPRAVIDAATAWRTRLEAAPMRFFVLDWQTEIDRARAALAAFLRAPSDRLAFVTSSTTGVAIALASANLTAGDEVLITDHTYRACKNQLVRLAAARGFDIVTVSIPLPFDADAFVDAFTRAITARTKLALVDHITSPSALRLPIERLVPALAARQVATIVDGAHAPGQIELDVGALLGLGATWYVGNNHKWLCAPKGSGFLVAASGVPVTPAIASHGASAEYGPPNRLHAELDWSGTHDPSAHLAVPAAIEVVAREGGGWPAVLARNHALAIEMRRRFIGALGTAPLPAPDDAIGTMSSIPIVLPAGVTALGLEQQLLAAGWEVPIVDTRPALVRLSAHLYNHAGEAEALARELHARGVSLASGG